MFARHRREPRLAMRLGRGREGCAPRIFGGKPAMIPSSIQARLRFNPSRCASFGSPGSGEIATGSQSGAGPVGNLRHEIRQPLRKLVRRKDTPHHIRLAQAGRKKIFARRFVGERAILVGPEKTSAPLGRQFGKGIVAVTRA